MANRNCSVLIMTRAGGIATQTGLTKAEAFKIREHFFPKQEPIEVIGFDDVHGLPLAKLADGTVVKLAPTKQLPHDVVKVEVFVGEE